MIDADGVVEVRNTYDDKGRVVTQISPFGRVTRFAYLPGRVTVVSDTDGTRSNTWLADARGRLVGITDSDGNRSSMAYDRWGNQVLATDPEGRVTARAFDERGRLTTEQSPTGARTDFWRAGLARQDAGFHEESTRDMKVPKDRIFGYFMPALQLMPAFQLPDPICSGAEFGLGIGFG